MKTLIIFPIIFFFLFSCNNSQSQKKHRKNIFNVENIKSFVLDASEIEEIDITNNSSTLIADSIFSTDVDFVRLENTSECIIGHIDNVLFADSLIIVVDKRITKAIYIL